MSRPRLFHFSENPGIASFVPRAVRMPSQRPEGREWLNGPLVWAIDQPHEFLYLFPRECPRILAWATPETTGADRAAWLGRTRVAAFIEMGWVERLGSDELTRYELAPGHFENIEDAGMWVSRKPVATIGRATLRDLPGELAARGVELTPVASLLPLRSIWETSLQVSGIRLRNAIDWRA